jgi:UPF0755 protein
VRRVFLALVVLILIAVALVAGCHWWVGREAHAPVVAGDAEPQEFEVPKGAVLQRLGKPLIDAGLIKNEPLVWRIWLRLHPSPPPKAGRHRLTKGMSMEEVSAELGNNPLADDFPVKILEGWRLVDVDEFLSKGSSPALADAGAYLKAAKDPTKLKIPFEFSAPSLEGYLYPETYMMPKGKALDLIKLIQLQLDHFNEAFAAKYADEIKKSGRTLHQIVTVASLLEREEPKPENRPIVAGIIYKRLDKGTPLGVDATSRYELPDWNDRVKFLAKLRDENDAYNSRKKAGLPPSPIGAPSITSLEAALRPQSSNWWFYLHDKDGNVHFAKNGAEHDANRQKYNVY